MKPTGAGSVMSSRKSPRSSVEQRKAKREAKHHTPKPKESLRSPDPRDGLDFFPTPPQGTRALFEHVLPHWKDRMKSMRAWEPCCGEGHMSEPLKEYFAEVYSSDVYPHGYGAVGSFVGTGGLELGDRATAPWRPDWLFTNPPFSLALEVVERMLEEAVFGVAILVRTNWLESAERYRLFCRHQPTIVGLFSERVPMVEFRWDPEASSATSYSWVVWEADENGDFPPAPGIYPSWQTKLIPPICRDTLIFDRDMALADQGKVDLFRAAP